MNRIKIISNIFVSKIFFREAPGVGSFFFIPAFLF